MPRQAMRFSRLDYQFRLRLSGHRGGGIHCIRYGGTTKLLRFMKNSVLSAVLLVVLPWGCARRNITHGQIEKRIANELPFGSSRIQIIDFLHLQGAEISEREPKVIARIRHAATN